MTKIPNKVVIGPHKYKITHDDMTQFLLKDVGHCGDCHPDRLEIRVDASLPHTSAIETVLHEILHCCWHQTALRADENMAEVEESVVTALSPLLVHVLRSNPKLVKYLLSEEE